MRNMASVYIWSLLLMSVILVNECTSAVAHGHGLDSGERAEDGSFRGRDSDHYGDSGHNSEFDHEAILGSVREAEKFEKMSPDEAKNKLSEMLPLMDTNNDKQIDRSELKQWILNSFVKLSSEEASERMRESDSNGDGILEWREYLQDAFGVDHESDVDKDDTGDNGMLIQDEKQLWAAADADGDGRLDLKEFTVFVNPEEHEEMHAHLIEHTIRERDTDGDGVLDFKEFMADRGPSEKDADWVVSERDRFQQDLDVNKDGVLDRSEIKAWIIPENEEIAIEEVDHLFASADDNHDERLSYSEILEHHDVFVGSEVMDDEEQAGAYVGEHFDDEL